MSEIKEIQFSRLFCLIQFVYDIFFNFASLKKIPLEAVDPCLANVPFTDKPVSWF